MKYPSLRAFPSGIRPHDCKHFLTTLDTVYKDSCGIAIVETNGKLTRDICKGSPPDEKLCGDPQFIFDRFRAIRPFATGNLEGAVIEEMQISQNLFRLEPLTTGSVLIVHGLHDNHYSLQETIDYWSGKWPNAEILPVEDGGQFLTSSHPELLVSLLEQLDKPTTPNAGSSTVREIR